MVRHNEMSAARYDKAGAIDPAARQGVHLVDQELWLDHDAIADHGGYVGVKDTARYELEGKPFTIHDDRVASVVAALVAHNHLHLFGEQVGEFRFSFVTPLGAYYHSRRHASAPPKKGAARTSIQVRPAGTGRLRPARSVQDQAARRPLLACAPAANTHERLARLSRGWGIFADDVDRDGVPVGVLALEQGHGQLVADAALDEALERPCPIGRVVAGPCEPVLGRVRDDEAKAPGSQAPLQVAQLNFHDMGNVGLGQLVEMDDLVDTVQELRLNASRRSPR